MKGKILSIVTAILFGASMMAAPIVMAADTAAAPGTEQVKPAKAEKKAAKNKKKKTAKATKKKGSKKKAAKQSAA